MSDEQEKSNDEQEKSNDEMKTSTTIGEDWDWEQVRDVWERTSSLHDHFKRIGTDLPWVARGTLFATMQMFLLECGGSVSLVKAVMSDLIQLCGGYVAGQLLAAMQSAWDSQELEGQKLSPPERANLKSNIETLESEIELAQVTSMSPEELDSALKAQDFLAQAVNEAHDMFGPDSTVRALTTVLQQCELFAAHGDPLQAKAQLLSVLHLMWPVALHNMSLLLKEASEMLTVGPASLRPN